MTFKLKDVAKNKQGTQLGKAGYMYFFTLDEVEKVVMRVGKAIGGDAFEVTMYKEKSTFDLKSGVLTVTVDKTTGKMTAAALTLTEQIAGVCMTGMTGPVRVSADIVGSATVNFKVS